MPSVSIAIATIVIVFLIFMNIFAKFSEYL